MHNSQCTTDRKSLPKIGMRFSKRVLKSAPLPGSYSKGRSSLKQDMGVWQSLVGSQCVFMSNHQHICNLETVPRALGAHARLVDARQQVPGHVHLEREDQADDVDDDGVHVGGCEGRLEACRAAGGFEVNPKNPFFCGLGLRPAGRRAGSFRV